MACSSAKNTSQKVGKLFSSQHSQRSWNRDFREQYPLLENTEFEAYQREFPTEWEKAQEIRRRIPDANELFVLPTESCLIPNKSSENYQECLTKVSENLNTQLLIPIAEGNLQELLGTKKWSKEQVLGALKPVRESILTLHQNRIIHNDISLENILWGYSAEGTVWCKLADFGISLFFPTRDDETLTARIEESVRSMSSNTSVRSMSSNTSVRSMSPAMVPQTFTPIEFTQPLWLALSTSTKKGFVPGLVLGDLKESPRNITIESEFESMKQRDLTAFEDILKYDLLFIE